MYRLYNSDKELRIVITIHINNRVHIKSLRNVIKLLNKKDDTHITQKYSFNMLYFIYILSSPTEQHSMRNNTHMNQPAAES